MHTQQQQKRIALITGASSGMGAEFARQIAALSEIDELWLIARREDRLASLGSTLEKPARCLPLDLSDISAADTLAAALEEANADVRLFVHAAGFGKYGSYEDLTREEVNGMIDVNLRSTVHMTYAVLPHMQKGGRIILLGSASAFQPLPYFNMYASTKAFVVHFSRALNVEVKPRGISVTAVCPGFVRTEFFSVAQQTKNPNACTNFSPMYEPADVIRKALRDSARGKDMSVLGFTTNIRRLGAKLLPTSWSIATWLKMK